MNITDLTSNELKRAASIKEKIETLNKELHGILGGSTNSGAGLKNKRVVSVTAINGVASKPATSRGKLASKSTKKAFSAATRAKLSAKLKAYWAAKRAGKK